MKSFYSLAMMAAVLFVTAGCKKNSDSGVKETSVAVSADGQSAILSVTLLKPAEKDGKVSKIFIKEAKAFPSFKDFHLYSLKSLYLKDCGSSSTCDHRILLPSDSIVIGAGKSEFQTQIPMKSLPQDIQKALLESQQKENEKPKASSLRLLDNDPPGGGDYQMIVDFDAVGSLNLSSPQSFSVESKGQLN